eukprot:gnl/MRDRNA2_/MRDRNA2_133302_c0_seq1.p1 gnl/MRDRNA2_/MRDRNA2_133302_c0~~gnl/MRDRNA2_/MRDRNA2_133302_c0_seq1.p1  ORF type:complete len:251 (+),score=20.08 gnl/MRDRNA2_/MRDRNA2_133302_c0_seq1:89-754(+)
MADLRCSADSAGGLWPLPGHHADEHKAHLNPGGFWPLPGSSTGGPVSPQSTGMPTLSTYLYTHGLSPGEASARLQTMPGGHSAPALPTYTPVCGLSPKGSREPLVLGVLSPGNILNPGLPTYTPAALPAETYYPGDRPQHTHEGRLWPMPGDGIATDHTHLHTGVLSEISTATQAMSDRAAPISLDGGLWPLPTGHAGQRLPMKTGKDWATQMKIFKNLDL